jgi:ATP-dependent helicase YprA (DUF1998 family)
VIEAELFSGRLLGVTATCALELGMDIGDLDVSDERCERTVLGKKRRE